MPQHPSQYHIGGLQAKNLIQLLVIQADTWLHSSINIIIEANLPGKDKVVAELKFMQQSCPQSPLLQAKIGNQNMTAFPPDKDKDLEMTRS